MPEPRHQVRKISAGVILVDPDGRVLLQLRDDDPKIMFPGHWGITGGAGLPGETPEQTARREVLEETGLTLGAIEPFKAYYFATKGAAVSNGKRGPKKPSPEYELYLYHAPCDTPAESMTCGEGRGLRFFAPHELPVIDVAYNHRDVLMEFFATRAYGRYLSGVPFADPDADSPEVEPLEHFRAALAAGDHWFDALLQAIALWQRPEETVDGRRYTYLIGGEAFDWLVLAERLLEDARDLVPESEAERLLFDARTPDHVDDDKVAEIIGPSKHRAHLNYLYGVIVEEALQYAVELDLQKERRTVQIDAWELMRDPVYERIYERPRADLLRDFRDANKLPHDPAISLSELREFMYWLFKYRVRTCEPARVASDTRKALAQLSQMEDAVRRSGRRPRRASSDDPTDGEEIAAPTSSV